jgi:uncharacterized protein (DUF1684 family)
VTSEPEDHWAREIEALHAARVARLRSERGWLSLVGKIFLSRGSVTLGSAPSCEARLPAGAPPHVGTITVDDAGVHFASAPEADVRIVGGERVSERLLRSDAHGTPDTLLASGFLLQLMERGDSLALRVRDVRELPRPFAGIERFPLDRAWRLEARLVPHPAPVRIAIEYEGATDGVVEESMSAPGVLVFHAAGGKVEMDALLETGASRLYIPFRDATNGDESYGAGRFVYAPLPDADGRVIVDFNAAMLPGCAFTVFATCPIPPPRNRLRLAVRAGEKHYAADPVGTASPAVR